MWGVSRRPTTSANSGYSDCRPASTSFLPAFRALNFNGPSDGGSGYALTYYPGTANLADAQKLTIGLGGSVSDVTLMLVPTRTARVSGTAFDSQGRPLEAGIGDVDGSHPSSVMTNGGSMIGLTARSRSAVWRLVNTR
jgi:hypothetical protein